PAGAQPVPPASMAARHVGAQLAAPASIALTLDEAIDRGLAASRRLAEAAARGDAAQAVVEQRRAAALPQVAAVGSYMRTNHVTPFVLPTPNATIGIYPDVPDNFLTRLDVQWP